MTGPEQGGMDDDRRPAGGSSADMVGTELGGRYRLVKLLGEGAMGAVYLGEHLRIGRHDAIKILRSGLSGDAESIARFHRGARNLSAIRHPNVCTLYDYGETADGSPFLALELISGESLKELLDHEGALDARRAIAIAYQTANALDAAHHAGIVHRDLKPANIMLERGREGEDVVKVVDFDIAKGPEPEGGDEVTRLGYVVGTPEYMSPEQLTGESLDGRSDIYSLGVTLYRMLTGVLPFRGTDVQKIMLERLTERPVPLVEARPDLAFPPEVQYVLDRALARDRSERYARSADIARELSALQRILEDSPVGARSRREVPETRVTTTGSQSSPVAAPPTRAKRPPAWMIAAGALAVLAVGVAAYMGLQGGDGGVASQPSGEQAGPAVGDSGQIAAADDRETASSTSGDAGDAGRAADPVNPGRTGRGGGSTDTGDTGGTRTDPPAQPASTRLTETPPLDILLDQLDRLPDDAAPLGVTTDRVIARAAADTADILWRTPGLVRRDSALAAYVRGMAALALRDRPGCVEWLERSMGLGHDPAGGLRRQCDNLDE